jgi:hypothetical protein
LVNRYCSFAAEQDTKSSFDPKADLIPIPNPVAAWLLRRLHSEPSSA